LEPPYSRINRMGDKTKVQLSVLAGSGVVMLGAWFLGKQCTSTAQTQQHQQEVATPTCECGLTMEQGGCTPQAQDSAPSFNSELLGTVGKYEKHFIICSGTDSDSWGAKIERDEGSFAQMAKEAISVRKADIPFKFKLTNSDERSKAGEGLTDLIVFPECIRYIGVTAETMPFIVEDHMVNGRISPRVKYEEFKSSLVLVCCHNNRDTRCGFQGPLIVQAFERLLKERNIGEDSVMVRQSSHLGGHKYAGVVVVYPRGDWFGFITEQHVEKLLDNYIAHGELVPEHWRGRMGIGDEEAIRVL